MLINILTPQANICRMAGLERSLGKAGGGGGRPGEGRGPAFGEPQPYTVPEVALQRSLPRTLSRKRKNFARGKKVRMRESLLQ